MVVVFLAGVFWKRANNPATAVTLALGVPLGLVAWVFIEILQVTEMQYLYACRILFLVSCLILVVGSLLTAPPSNEQAENAWSLEIWQEHSRGLSEKPWHANFRIWAIGLMLLTGVLVVWWW